MSFTQTGITVLSSQTTIMILGVRTKKKGLTLPDAVDEAPLSGLNQVGRGPNRQLIGRHRPTVPTPPY